MTILMSPVTRCFFWMETSPNRRVDNHKAQKIHTQKKNLIRCTRPLPSLCDWQAAAREVPFPW